MIRLTDNLTAKSAGITLLAGLMIVSTCSPVAALPQPTLQAQTGQVDKATEAQPEASKDSPAPKLLWKPGQSLSLGTDSEDLVPTDDVDLARRQVAAYPDSPEAAFILAVALTRTSHVEEAIKEVQRARRLADKLGGPLYFDKMIGTYEEMLKSYPDDNRVRYGLAWAYYMKAYALASYSRKVARTAAAKQQSAPPTRGPNQWEVAAATGATPLNELPHIKGALEKADATAVPEIRKYYESALAKLDELLVQQPDDIWAKVYRAFLNAEYTGNLDEAMGTWRACQAQAPTNPAPYFFLGEGYLRQGNLKECLNHISKAIALRALGN
jgi:tetratricopeptide (TPR) repeat protein